MPLLRVALLLLLAVVGARAAGAQGAGGIVLGRAVREEDGAPVAFALVRLVPASAPTDVRRPSIVAQAATSASGAFRIADVPPGEYRLQLARIGHQPLVGGVLRVAAGDTVRHELRARSQPLQLAAVRIRAGGDCLTSERIDEEPRLAALWREAAQGVELRRAFERQYRFTRVARQEVTLARRWRRDRRTLRLDTLAHDPDSVEARERQALASGYATAPNMIRLPNEKELLDERFLRTHCLERAVAARDGEVGLRFRPVRTVADSIDVRGTVWIDAATYQIRRLDFEHLEGATPFATATLEYEDVPVEGGALRLPVRGRAALRVRGREAARLSGARMVLGARYADFVAAGTGR